MKLNNYLTTINDKKKALIVIKDIKELNTFHLLNDEQSIVDYSETVLSQYNISLTNNVFKLIYSWLTMVPQK